MIVEEYEDNIIQLYVNDTDDKKEELCTKISNICDNYPPEDDNDDDNNINSMFDYKNEL